MSGVLMANISGIFYLLIEKCLHEDYITEK